MSDLIMGGVAVLAPVFIGWAWTALLSRERTIIFGWRFAAVVGTFLGQKIGKKGGDIAVERVSTTLDDFTAGVRFWLRGDPKPSVADLKERAKKANGG